jgi:spermidine synthase
MLEIVVFICGASVMALEMVGARIISPYFGSSIVVWSSLIGTILASLSFGYWWGGRIADRNPSLKSLALIILLSGICTSLVAVAKSIIIDVWGGYSTPIYIAATIMNLVLFAPVSILLGMVSPYAVRLKTGTMDHIGSTVGRLYALSTIGSIFGTFFTGFFLVTVMGSTAILISIGVVLILLSILVSSKDRLIKVTSLTLIWILGLGLIAYGNYLNGKEFYDLDTYYSRVFIFQSKEKDTDRPIRVMATTPRFSQSAMYLEDPITPALDYGRFFKSCWYFNPAAKQFLVLGGGGYSFPKFAIEKHPDIKMKIVELDPGITQLAQRFFFLKDPLKFTIFHEDARTFINRCKEKFDVILSDVFNNQYSVPFQLTTIETVRRLHEMLAEGGVVIVNTIGSIEGTRGRFLRAEYSTFQKVFPHAYIFPLQYPQDGEKVQNVMIVATDKTILFDPPFTDSDVEHYVGQRWLKPISSDMPILTDDYAPVENYMFSANLH